MLTAGMMFRPHTSHYLLASFLSVSSFSTAQKPQGFYLVCLNTLSCKKTLYSPVDCSLPPHIATRPFFLFSTHRYSIIDCSLPPHLYSLEHHHAFTLIIAVAAMPLVDVDLPG